MLTENFIVSDRVKRIKSDMLNEGRFASIEQARIITDSVKKHLDEPRCLQRAHSLAAALHNISIRVDADELIVGNRSVGVRAGIVFPETGSSWVDREFETLPTRPQDRFNVHREDIEEFRAEILPFWKGRSLEDCVRERLGGEVDDLARVVKINQKDHSQGHICPNTIKWLTLGPRGIASEAQRQLDTETDSTKKAFYQSVVISYSAACDFIGRYADLAAEKGMTEVAQVCEWIAEHPARSFHEAVQSVWFLYVILQMEGNASSFSPGRMDRYLLPYYNHSRDEGMTREDALEIMECLFLKFNQIVYLRNSGSAKYFAGFPIGFNVAIGGIDGDGNDTTNELSYLFLKAQQHLGLPQPNLSCRIHKDSPQEFLCEAASVVGQGSGMPQFFNDESVIPALIKHGVSQEDAKNYAIVGCVELTTHGNSLAWSDAAMFNLLKVLELTVNNGVDMLDNRKSGLALGNLEDFESYEALERAFETQINHFTDRMVQCVTEMEYMHELLLPTPFLSGVIDDCLAKGQDVTQGGAKYNFAGVQAIQVANVADSLAAIKKLVFVEKIISARELRESLSNNFAEKEMIRQLLLNKVPKYGNDDDYVDTIGSRWVDFFADRLKKYKNRRGGIYQMGLYTVSAHVPMGQNVAASADGRYSREPLADGGVSAMYGRDKNGPTALLQSVSKLDFSRASNGSLLNMKFLPSLFRTKEGVERFASFLRAFVKLGISHVQFNVFNAEDLHAAKNEPEKYKGLTVRVAGYTAYFVELAEDLQNEIIERTCYEGV